ncbi:MAG: hypothetical protein ACRD0G_09705 [Acidimicrobiales bacterium]
MTTRETPDTPKPPPSRPKRRRQRRATTPGGAFWHGRQPVPDPGLVVPVDDPTMLVRSLGDPRLGPEHAWAEYYVAGVANRAASVAVALAAAGGLLAEPGDEA